MAGELLKLALACVSDYDPQAVPHVSDAMPLPMNELIETCLMPDVDVVPIDPETLDYDEDGVDFVQDTQIKFIKAVEDQMHVDYQELISGKKPFTVVAVHQDDGGNYKTQKEQLLAFTLGDYFATEEEFPFSVKSTTDVGYSPKVPPGDWFICRSSYAWSSCTDDGGEFATKGLDYFAGENSGSRSADDLKSRNDYRGEFFAVYDDYSGDCDGSLDGYEDWMLTGEVLNDESAPLYLGYLRDDFILTQAETSFGAHFNALEERVEGLANVNPRISVAGGSETANRLFYGAFYCENNSCYDVEFETEDF